MTESTAVPPSDVGGLTSASGLGAASCAASDVAPEESRSEAGASSLYEFLRDLQARVGDPTLPPDETPQPRTDLGARDRKYVTTLQEATEAGGFLARSALGQKFERPISPDEKESYKAI